jgi:hypothetical protein
MKKLTKNKHSSSRLCEKEAEAISRTRKNKKNFSRVGASKQALAQKMDACCPDTYFVYHRLRLT